MYIYIYMYISIKSYETKDILYTDINNIDRTKPCYIE